MTIYPSIHPCMQETTNKYTHRHTYLGDAGPVLEIAGSWEGFLVGISGKVGRDVSFVPVLKTPKKIQKKQQPETKRVYFNLRLFSIFLLFTAYFIEKDPDGSLCASK